MTQPVNYSAVVHVMHEPALGITPTHLAGIVGEAVGPSG